MLTFDERRLAGRIRAGEPQAFRDLYDAYGARVLGYALRLTGCREEAEDLVQETFVACFSCRTSFEGRSRLISWLLGIATRRWRDRIRKQAPQTVPLEENGGLAAPQPDLVAALNLTQALSRLDAPFREALLLVRSQELSYAEAASILGEPVGTVKWRVSEATRRTQQILKEMDGESDEVRESTREDRSACRR